MDGISSDNNVSSLIHLFDLELLCTFSTVICEEIDSIIRAFVTRHGSSRGETYIPGHLRAIGYTVQRRRIMQ